MKSFSFRLETVRALKKHVESRALESLARELNEDTARKAELAQAQTALAAARALSTSAVPSVEELLVRQAYVERLERVRTVAEVAAETQEQRVEQQRSAAETAVAERSALDKLESRARAEHKREAAAAEDAALGEIAIARHARSGREAA